MGELMTSKEIEALANDPEQNTLGLSFMTLYGRIKTRSWAIERALSTPPINRAQAGRNSRENPTWNNFHLS